ncbi:MAG: aminotransferase class V-fold PLP-dependent enzyme [Thermaerobacter sp.]|nr:aminotransferase class V-fold PLP-dependent enzyme [Thermaerobacter sp.]
MTPEAFRQHFPIFKEKAHLCSCSEGALSLRVTQAMDAFMASWRTEGAPWGAWMEQVERARRGFAALIHADPAEVAAVSCASEGAYQIASTLDFGERCRILTTDLEFPSVAHIWLGAERRGARVQFLPERNGVTTAEDYLTGLSDDTALVSVPLVSYGNGLRLPVHAVAQAAHARGAKVFVDAYQGAGVVPIDVRTLPCDYLVAGTLKYLLGAPGLAFLYVRNASMPEGLPPYSGWFGREAPFGFTPRILDYAPDARRFQGGTPAIPAAYAGAAGLSLVQELDQDAVLQHVLSLGDWLQDAFLEEGVPLYSPTERTQRGPQVAVRAGDADRLAEYLAARGVLVSPRGQAVRISLHYYNTLEDLTRVFQGVLDYRRTVGL